MTHTPPTSQPLTTAREHEIRTLDLTPLMNDLSAARVSGYLATLLDEVDRLRAVLDAEKDAHLFTLRQRNNRSRRLAQLHDLAVAGDTEALTAAAKDTLAASVDDHRDCHARPAAVAAAAETGQ